METFSHKRKRRASKSILFVGILVLLTMLLAACGSTSTGSSAPTPNPQTPTVAPPTDLITPGTLTVGRDPTYPRFETVDSAAGQAQAFALALVTSIPQRRGLKA